MDANATGKEVMSSPPRVSVVMTVYNGLPFLETALESVLEQRFTDFEFIVIDDGSTDGSGDVLRHCAAQDRRVRLFSQENIGITPSLNRGLRKVRGEYVARMDDDDICHPERFGRQVAYLDDHPDCVAVGGQAIVVDENGAPVRHSDSPPCSGEGGEMKALYQDHESIEKELLEGTWPILHPASMLRREAVEAVGGYDERFATNQDHDLFLKLAELGRLANLSATVLKYRRHSGQLSSSQSGCNFASKYRKAWIRREAYQRRGLSLPQDVQWSSLVGLLLRRELSETALWPYVQKTWGLLDPMGHFEGYRS